MSTLFNKWVSFGLQWRLGQSGEHPENEQTTKEQDTTNLWKTNEPLVAYRCRHYHIEYIQIVAKKYHDTRHDHKPVDPFVVAVHQYQQWEHKVHHQHSEEGQFVVLKTCDVVGYLFRDIGIPNQHEL